MDRKYFKTSMEDLVFLMKENLKRRLLGEIRDELTSRKTDAAKQLRREVEGIRGGDIPLRHHRRRKMRSHAAVETGGGEV